MPSILSCTKVLNKYDRITKCHQNWHILYTWCFRNTSNIISCMAFIFLFLIRNLSSRIFWTLLLFLVLETTYHYLLYQNFIKIYLVSFLCSIRTLVCSWTVHDDGVALLTNFSVLIQKARFTQFFNMTSAFLMFLAYRKGFTMELSWDRAHTVKMPSNDAISGTTYKTALRTIPGTHPSRKRMTVMKRMTVVRTSRTLKRP